MNSGKIKFFTRNKTLTLAGLVMAASGIVVLLLLGFRVSPARSPLAPAELSPGVNLARISLPFVENRGQWDNRVRFKADLFSGALVVTEEELVYSLVSARSGKVEADTWSEDWPVSGPTSSRMLVFKEKFLAANGRELSLTPAGKEAAETAVSYFNSPDSTSWKRRLASYGRLRLGRVYPGIDVELKATGGNVEKFFYLSPGARVEDISIKVEGIEALSLSDQGNLVLNSSAGPLEMVKPVGYQEIAAQRHPVEVAYELRGRDEYGFKISGSYDPDFPLVIDPALSTLSASTFIGGTGNDRGYCIGVNASGKVYVAGYTVSIFSSDFPTTTGVIDTSANGSFDLFISRLDNSLTQLEASTYLGGSSSDYVNGLSIAEDGNIFLTGITSSRDFPVTAGAFQTQYRGGEYDAFVVKISPDLDLLLGSTYLGGSGIDYGADLKVIPASYNNDTIVVVGMTDSADFPVTPDTYSTSLRGGLDAFVAVIYNSLGSLDATFIGGSDYDIASAVAVDGLGHFWVAGRTRSADFPVALHSFDETYNGDYDGFVLHLDYQLNVIYGSTYIGGSGADFLYGLSLKGEVNPEVYVAGYTSSSDFPVTESAYDKTFSGIYDVFVSKLDTSLSYLLASTFLGGAADDRCRAIAVDANGNPYIAGWTRSASYPITSFTYDSSHDGGWDAFVTKLSVKLGAVLASTFIGGGADDLAYGLAIDDAGDVYLTGYTQSSTFPMTEETYDDEISSTDVFVARFAAVGSYQLTVSRTGDGSGSVTSVDGGIDCGSDCSETYDEGFIVILKAEPAENSVFGGWSGDVTSPDNPIYFTMDSDKNITASFAPAEATYTLTVVRSGPGNGTITSEDEGINCGDVCSAAYPAGTLVKLTATPDELSGFERWDGDISGTSKTISFLMDGDKTVVAVFGPYPLSDLSGEWSGLKVSRFLGQTIVLSGFLKLINDGDGELKGNYKISYYLSADGQSLDTLIETRSLSYNLAPDSTRIITVAWYLSQNLNPVGKYLVAILDADNEIEEKDENNNRVVFGPITATSENGSTGQEQRTGVRKLSEAIKGKIGK
ncbi:MAG: SBBP repeat-containing protein [Candidatus Aminicenantes bacterium]|nr:SBBP repeat-containing protein [Candidatus Aminicenantes bacterium]